MLDKPSKMTQRLPALVVPDDMHAQLSDLSKETGLTLSEVIRQGLAFFLSANVNHIDKKKKEDNTQ